MTTRHSGIRHALDATKRARKAMDEGKVAAALRDWWHAGSHLGFVVGLTENPQLSLASVLLRKSLMNLGTRIERAITPRAAVYGWAVAEPVAEALAALADAHDLTPDEITDTAALAASEIVRRFRIEER